jgi:16S rRNA G966 N2-methylase RsmD
MRRPTDPSLPIDYYEPVFDPEENPRIQNNYYEWYTLKFDLIDGKWECRPYETKGSTKYKIYDEYGLDGGGRNWGSSFPIYYKKLNPTRTFKRCLDWCSGPGYCGFEMMDFGLCETLALMDLHDLAIKYANITIEKNNCQDKVVSYHLDRISNLPYHEKFDIVIGNPPHSSDINSELDADQTRILSDVGWTSHQEFFNNIGRYLTDDGVIWLCENGNTGAGPVEIFKPMIDANGFKIKNNFVPHDFDINRNPYYFLEIVRV